MGKNKKNSTEWDARGRGDLRKCFEFYALLATQVSFRLLLVRRRGGRRYASTSVRMLTALTIHPLKVEKPSVAVLRSLQRAFRPNRFLC